MTRTNRDGKCFIDWKRTIEALFALVVFCFPDVSAQVRGEFIVHEGETAPTFSYVTQEGDTLDTDFLRNKVTVIQFAASWCPFSQAQLVDHQYYLWDKHSSNPDFSMMVFCVDKPEDRTKFQEQIKADNVVIPYCFDGGDIYNSFCTPNGSVTRTIIIDREWRIAHLHEIHTYRDLRQIRRQVRRMLRE